MNDGRSLDRRAVLGSCAGGLLAVSAGCFGLVGGNNREVHQVVRSWQENNRLSIRASEGEVIGISIDTRRNVPVATGVGIYPPDEDFIGAFALDASQTAMYHEAEIDGVYEFSIRPVPGDVDPERVWIRLQIVDAVPDDYEEPDPFDPS